MASISLHRNNCDDFTWWHFTRGAVALAPGFGMQGLQPLNITLDKIESKKARPKTGRALTYNCGLYFSFMQ